MKEAVIAMALGFGGHWPRSFGSDSRFRCRSKQNAVIAAIETVISLSAIIETVISLSAITSLLSLSAALVATWVMQVTTTHQAGLDSSIARLALASQRIALAALAIFLMLNAVTPFITPDPPWLANLPLVIAIMAFLLAFGLSHIRADRVRGASGLNPTRQE
jgi:hypothetical protein